MTAEHVLKLVEILAWPAVAVLAILLLRPHVSALLSGAKVRLSLGGQTIETTLPELRRIIEEQAGASLSPAEIGFLGVLQTSGTKQYPNGADGDNDTKVIRTLRNHGLVQTVPRNAFLGDARAIEISALGRLLLTSRAQPKSSA